MSDSNNSKSKSEDNKSLEDFYKFDRTTDQKLKNGEKLPFFEEVQNLIPVVKNASKKMDAIEKGLKQKIKELEKELSERQKKQASKAKDNKKEDLANADLSFCRGAVNSCKAGKVMIEDGLKDLEDILKTGEERNYSVIVDVALMPLPSDRAKQKDKDNDNEGGDAGGQDNGDENGGNPAKNEEKDKTPGKLSPEQLAALRGMPDKNKGSNVSGGTAAEQELETGKESLRPRTKEDRDKILAARNGIAPEDMGKETEGRPVQQSTIDFSKMPSKGHTH